MSTSLPGLAGSFLGDLEPQTLEDLLDSAVLREYKRGAPIFREPPHPRIGLILEGTARAYLSDPDGRQLTVRYAGPRSSISSQTSGVAQNSLQIDVQAVSNVSVIEFGLQEFGRLQQSRPDLVSAVATETQRRLSDVYRTFAATTFGSVGERLAAHLLDSAESSEAGLVAPVTQEDLAQAVGTAREVVSRVLRQFQSEGVVTIKRGGVTIVDTQGLMARSGRWGTSSRLFAMDMNYISEQSFDNAPQPVVGVDLTADIIYANQAVGATFGWSPRDLVGRPLTVLLPVSMSEHHSQLVAASIATIGPGRADMRGHARGLRADGSEFPAEVTLLPVRRGSSRVVFATVVDLTYRSALRERIRVQPTEPL